MKTFKSITFLALLISSAFAFYSCNNDEDNLIANIMLTEGIDGDIGGDFTGNGGNASKTFSWVNSLSTADYNADITASTSGVFQMIVTDSDGNTVLNRSLNGNESPDTFSGVTSTGSPGTWSVTINLSNFNGDGSFTLSEGN